MKQSVNLDHSTQESNYFHSHQLRSSLCVIKEGLSFLLTTQEFNEDQKETLAIINKNVDRLTRLIDDVCGG